MNDRLRDLLQMAKQGEQLGKTEPVSFAAVARTTRDHVATSEARLTTVGDRTVVVDRGRLTQLLENFFVNALKHGAPRGSEIGVHIGVDDDGCLFVEDDDRGIPAEDRQDVFESGYTTATDGTGYGLAIVRQVARAHAWTVSVTESDADGARFEFRDVAFADS